MTPRDIVKLKLKYIGVLSFDPATNANSVGRRAIEAGDVEFACACLTGGIEEMLEDGPAALSEKRYSNVLRAPTNVTLDVTNGSATIANLTTYAAWQIGCTIRIAGDNDDNEIVSSTELLRPYLGATGTGRAAVVYSDAIKLPGTIKNVLDPVKLPNIIPLLGTSDRERFMRFGQDTPMDAMRQPEYASYILQNKTIGQPAIWMAENAIDTTVAGGNTFLRFNPMPGQAYSVTAKVKVRAPIYTPADIFTSSNYDTDPGAVIPVDSHASIVLPFALMRFTAHPSFDSKAVREIERQYAVARKLLSSCKPTITTEAGDYH